MNTRNIIIIIIVLAVILIAGYMLLNSNNLLAPAGEESDNQNNEQTNGQNNQPINNTTAPKTHEVVYTDAGYTPAELTVKVADTVVFKNQSSGQMWVGSAMHPTHIVYGGTSLQQHCPDPENDDFDQCAPSAPGSEWSFTFNKAGSWGYHNHVSAGKFGKVIVQ